MLKDMIETLKQTDKHRKKNEHDYNPKYSEINFPQEIKTKNTCDWQGTEKV